METCLYLVATPIGNLEDITLRAIETLKIVDFIACEDTRTSNKLLTNFGIKKKLISLHQHNEKGKTDFLINELKNGKSIAYLSDAGTPAISDPGALLVDHIHNLRLDIFPIPGPSALITAFSVAGFQTTHFQFYGFLPNTSGKCKKALQKIITQIWFVFYMNLHIGLLKLLNIFVKFLEKIILSSLPESLLKFLKLLTGVKLVN